MQLEGHHWHLRVRHKVCWITTRVCCDEMVGPSNCHEIDMPVLVIIV